MNAIGSIHMGQILPVVAIPVRNEASNILGCLSALSSQTYRGYFEVLLLLNDCTDGTEAVIQQATESWPFRLHMVCRDLQVPSAGLARQQAMDQAADLTNGVILTTDADSRVGRSWIAANLGAIARGADAVAGKAEIDPVDAARLPAKLLENEARVVLLSTLLDRIDWLMDPDPADPWPRHVQHSGASIAVTVECYHRAEGMPSMPLGEDRAFFQRLRQVDARIRHHPDVVVTVSGRLAGRAVGGMADTMRRRIQRAYIWLDETIEPAAKHADRAICRALARRA